MTTQEFIDDWMERYDLVLSEAAYKELCTNLTMNHSLLFYGPIPSADAMQRIAEKHGLSVVTDWAPSKKFPRMGCAVFVPELPASFKHDKRVRNVQAIDSR